MIFLVPIMEDQGICGMLFLEFIRDLVSCLPNDDQIIQNGVLSLIVGNEFVVAGNRISFNCFDCVMNILKLFRVFHNATASACTDWTKDLSSTFGSAKVGMTSM